MNLCAIEMLFCLDINSNLYNVQQYTSIFHYKVFANHSKEVGGWTGLFMSPYCVGVREWPIA